MERELRLNPTEIMMLDTALGLIPAQDRHLVGLRAKVRAVMDTVTLPELLRTLEVVSGLLAEQKEKEAAIAAVMAQSQN